MYRIYVGDQLIYSPTMVRKNYIILNPQLNMELNKASTLTFVAPQISVRKDLLKNKLKAEVTVYDDERRIFRGRIISDTKDFMQSSEVYCEGELAYLRDAIVRPYTFAGTPAEYFAYMLSEFADSDVDDYKKFEVGIIDGIPDESADFGNDQYPDFISEMTENLLNKYGGYFVPRYSGGTNYLDYLADPGGRSGERVGAQVIQYGKNLLDMTQEETAAPTFTVIIPLGSQCVEIEGSEKNEKRRLTLADDASYGLDYIAADSDFSSIDYTEKYGWIENVVTHDEITEWQDLYDAGVEDLEAAIKTQTTIEIAAVDLKLINESDEPLTLGKQYRLKFDAAGYSQETDRIRLNRAELNLLSPSESRYYFGALSTSLSHEAVQTKRTMNQVTKVAIEAAEQASELAESIAGFGLRLSAVEAAISGLADQADFVTSAGSSGGWYVRSWDRGYKNISGHATVTISSWANKTATVSISIPTMRNTGYACNANVSSAGELVSVCGIEKQTNQINVTLYNHGATDPATLSVDVQITGQ